MYMALASGGTAEPVAFLTKWEINFATDRVDQTAFGDLNKQYTSGLPDASGSFEGWYDDATVQTYTAATDGLARPFYLYPDNSSTGKYFWGTILPDFKATGGVAEGVAVSSSWAAASNILKVG